MQCQYSQKVKIIFVFTLSVELFAHVILSRILQADVVIVCRAVVFVEWIDKVFNKHENIPTLLSKQSVHKCDVITSVIIDCKHSVQYFFYL